MAQAVSRRPLTGGGLTSIPGQSMWDLWQTKWQWDGFFPEYFGFHLSISFHRSFITRKNEKNLIIFITGLHNKYQGCGASVASATGHFTDKEKAQKNCENCKGRAQVLCKSNADVYCKTKALHFTFLL
jgi:hypothetical protein